MRMIVLFLSLLLAVPAVAGPRVSRDHAYGADSAQRFDVYWDDAVRNAPVIVMLHGGAWAIGDKSNRAVWAAKVAHWRPQGLVFVSLNTRLLPEARPDRQAADLARAVAAVQDRARRWGGDPGAVILMGHSAGAHLAALLGTDIDLQARHGVAPLRGTVVLDTAALDLEAVMTDRPARLYRRAFGSDPAYWRSLSPLRQLDRRAPPVLAVCSSLRRHVCDTARRFARAAAGKGVIVSVLPVQLSHREVNANLGRASPYTDAVSDWIANRLR